MSAAPDIKAIVEDIIARRRPLLERLAEERPPTPRVGTPEGETQ